MLSQKSRLIQDITFKISVQRKAKLIKTQEAEHVTISLKAKKRTMYSILYEIEIIGTEACEDLLQYQIRLNGALLLTADCKWNAAITFPQKFKC